MRVLVLGGSGFIGPYIVAALQRRGHELATFSRRETTAMDGVVQFTGDRRQLRASAAALRGYAPNVVVDVILSSGAQARELVEVFRGVASRIVAISSIDVYRACAVLHRLEEGPLEPVPLTESSTLRTRLQTYPLEQIRMLESIFGWLDDEYDKIPAEREVLSSPAIEAVVLRLPIVYGPGDRLHRLRPLLMHMNAGLDDYIMAESVARWRAPRGYVENVAHAIASAAVDERAAGRIYNVAEPPNFSEREWAEQVASAIGWRGQIVVVPDQDAPPNPLLAGNLRQHWSADSQRIRRELGYTEVVPVDEAIRRTAAWEALGVGHPSREGLHRVD